MQAIKITVALLSVLLNVFMLHTGSAIAAANTASQPTQEKTYSKTQKSLIELGFQPPKGTQPQTGVIRPQNKRRATLREQSNTGVVGVVSGDVNGIDIRMAADLAVVLDGVENLRILPILGKDAVQNISDLLYLKGVDLSIVQADVLAYLLRKRPYHGPDRRIRYITKLYRKEMHLLVGKETGTIQDLAGKKVNFGIDASGTNMTASIVFAKAGIEVEPTFLAQALALEQLKQGQIAGMVYVVGKPAQLFQNLETARGLHFIPVPIIAALADMYVPAQLTAEDYPALIPSGRSVNTVAVSTVLAVYNWKPDTPRYRKVAHFVDAFFFHFTAFNKPPRHKQWTAVDLTAQVPGWTRFQTAEDWLKQNTGTPKADLRTKVMQVLSGAAPVTDQPPVEAKQSTTMSEEELRKAFMQSLSGATPVARSKPINPTFQPQSQLTEGRAGAREAQKILNHLGYNVGTVDGILGPKTTAALKKFQTDQGMPPDGTLDFDLLTILRAEEELSR